MNASLEDMLAAGFDIVPLIDAMGSTGQETFDISGIEEINSRSIIPNELLITANGKQFRAIVRIDTPGEAEYYRHGGIMQYVLRSLLANR